MRMSGVFLGCSAALKCNTKSFPLPVPVGVLSSDRDELGVTVISVGCPMLWETKCKIKSPTKEVCWHVSVMSMFSNIS